MSTWRQLTEQDILDRLADGEWETYEDAGEPTGAKARLPGILVQVTSLIRGAIEQNPKNYVGDAGTLPEASIYHACTLARLSLIGSQPTNEGETTPRQREENAAWKYVEAIQKGDITFPNVTPPVEPSSGTFGGKCLLEF